MSRTCKCVGLDHKPATKLDHIQCHVVRVRSISSGIRLGRRLSADDIIKARNAADEALQLMEDLPPAQQRPDVEDMLRSFLDMTTGYPLRATA